MPNERIPHSRPEKNRKTRKGKDRSGLSVSLYVNKNNREVVVKVINNNTLDVIRAVSSQELFDIKDRISVIADVLFQEKY